MKNKRIIILSTIFLLVIISLSIIIIARTCMKSVKKINLVSWYDAKEENYICELPAENEIIYSLPYSSVVTVINYDGSYIKNNYNWSDFKMKIRSAETDVKMEFINNNWYCYYDLGSDFMIRLVSTEVFWGNNHFYIPINMVEIFSYQSLYELTKERLLDYFSNYSFEDVLPFFKRYTENVTIDEENKIIYFVSKDISTSKNVYTLMDYKNSKFMIKKDNEYVAF